MEWRCAKVERVDNGLFDLGDLTTEVGEIQVRHAQMAKLLVDAFGVELCRFLIVGKEKVLLHTVVNIMNSELFVIDER
jgi:hypothetical protein